MTILHLSRRAFAPLVLALALAGCGGGGGGSKALTPAETAASAFSTANVSGSFDTPAKAHARASVPTVVTVQFSKDNTGDTGVASFVTGSSVDPATFAAYAADISNVDYTITSNTATAITGTVSYDLNHFTANKYFTDTTHFTGTYTIKPNAVSTLVITGGTFTGKDPNGTATTATVPTFSFVGGASNIDLSGTYGGKATYSGLSLFSFTGATLAKVSGDGLHLNGTIPFTPPGGSATTLTFNGAYTRSSLSGATTIPADITFTAPVVGAVTIPKGSAAQVYLTSADGGKTITGSLLVDTSLLGNVVLDLSGTKTSASTGTGGGTTGGGGGTTSAFKTGYYDGGFMRNGQLDGRILKLNVAKVSSTAGANGALIIDVGTNVTSGPNVGARIASISGSGSGFTLTADNFTSTYTKMVITGTVNGTALTATYTGTLLGGGTETGSFDQLGQGSTTTTTLNGTYAGSLVDSGSGTTTPLALTLKSASDGTVSVATSSTASFSTDYKLPTITGYVAGTSIALKDSSEGTSLPSPFTGDTFYGNFGGAVSGSTITGTYVEFVLSPSGSYLFSGLGKLSLTKQ